ncbi:MAG: DUF1513 domain-containing protein [Marinobacter sp.]
MATDSTTAAPVNPARRRLLAAVAGTLVASQTAGCQWLISSGDSSDIHVGATRVADGSYGLQGVTGDGQVLWQQTVKARCHGGCSRPDSDHTVVFERRPGWRFYVLELRTGAILHEVKAAAEEHFYGHGVFSQDGRRLYATVNRYETGEGIIAVFDVASGYRRVDSLLLNGIGPHEIRLHPDGRTLVVALGGIQTHPDYPRLKQNLASMSPALVLLDRHTGQITGRYQPSNHQLSCRHLDVSPDGQVWVGYQYQGPDYQAPPLIGHLDGENYREIQLPGVLRRRMANYTASVAVSPVTGQVAITAPRGGVTIVLDGADGHVLREVDIPDCAGAKALREGTFMITSGTGQVTFVPPSPGSNREITHHNLQWDNHLI